MNVTPDNSYSYIDSEEVSKPFLDQGSPSDLEMSKNEPYFVEFEGQTLFIDSIDWRKSIRLRVQIFAVALTFILFGLAEQAVGTLIPILQKQYQVNDIQTSCIYLSSITGYITTGILNGHTHDKLGLRGVLMTGSACMGIAYIVFSTAPPFVILVMFAVFSGAGCGVLDAACNTWAGALIDSNPILGMLHGCYGLGSMLSPSVITHLLERKENPWKWNQYYLVLASIALTAFFISMFCFKYETGSKHRYVTRLKIQKEHAKMKDIEMQQFEIDGSEAEGSELDDSELLHQQAGLKEVMAYPLTWLMAFVIFIYVGAEVGFGAWLITFLIRIDKLDYKLSSYIATTFWAGLTVGRTVLGFTTAFFKNELYANYTYIGLSLVGYILFYIFSLTAIVPLIFIIVFYTGFVVGPIYATTITSTMGILPSKYHASGIGFMCAVGGSGAAGVPFLVGAVAESSLTGLKVYPLVIMGLFVILFIVWTYIIRRFSQSFHSIQ